MAMLLVEGQVVVVYGVSGHGGVVALNFEIQLRHRVNALAGC